MCAGCEQTHANDTLVKYVYKYMSKPQQQHRVLCSGLHNCPVMWHAQACMLLRVLPLDVVRVICAHVCERAAITLCKSGAEELSSVMRQACAIRTEILYTCSMICQSQ